MKPDFIKKIQAIQQEYTADKTENNEFGGYKYRNIEKMLGSLKPLLKKHDLIIYFSDDIKNLGDRYYIESTATITDGTSVLSVSASAREEFEKKKTDASQLTGSASTYARKYALCGLLGVDDGSNDPDSKDNDREHYSASAPKAYKLTGPATDKQRETIKKGLEKIGIALDDQAEYLMQEYGVEIPLTKEGASGVIDDLFSNGGNNG